MNNPSLDEKFKEAINEFDSNINKSQKNLDEMIKNNNPDDQLIEKIVSNTVSIFSSKEMQDIIKSFNTTFDEKTTAGIINMIAYASSVAAHQAIVFYDDMLRKELIVQFQDIINANNINASELTVLKSVMEVFKSRLDEIRNRIQNDEVNK